ncbi:HRDC domain protein, partial [Actinobacillus suis]
MLCQFTKPVFLYRKGIKKHSIILRTKKAVKFAKFFTNYSFLIHKDLIVEY